MKGSCFGHDSCQVQLNCSLFGKPGEPRFQGAVIISTMRADQVSAIINFDPAKDWSIHVHRIGRAGGLSAKDQQQEGSACTLLLPSNGNFAKALIRACEREDRPIPPGAHQIANQSKRDCGSGDVEQRNSNVSGSGHPVQTQQNAIANNQHEAPRQTARPTAYRFGT